LRPLAIACAAAGLLLGGCSTIYFDRQNPVPAPSYTVAKWHHNFALDLYEGSAPVNLRESCTQRPWVSVKVTETFLNGLASTGANLFGPIWYPRTVEVGCR
jgi:hypothetical protein